MRLNVQNTAEIRGDLAPSEFKIQASAKAFRILSDNLYSDKVWAVVRELVANAVDAHKAAGKEDLPVRVKIPNALDPMFEVEDWGTGLSHEQVMELYTTYFASDKTDTNSLIGGFGLGSKSPFALTDQFTVTSWYDGVERNYVCLLDGDVPKVVPSPPHPTDRCNGLKVSIRKPSNTDRHSWLEAAKRLLPYMRIAVEGATIEAPEIKVLDSMDVDGCTVELVNGNGGVVVMGGVPYPIPDCVDPSPIQADNLRAFAPIGYFDVSVSREHLALTKETVGKLKRVFDAARAEFIERSRKRLDFGRENLGEFLDRLGSRELSDVDIYLLDTLVSSKRPLVTLTPSEGRSVVMTIHNRPLPEGSVNVLEVRPSHVSKLPGPGNYYNGKSHISPSNDGPRKLIVTWGVRSPSNNALVSLCEAMGAKALIVLHLPSTEEDETQVRQIYANSGLSETLAPLVNVRVKALREWVELKSHGPKAKRKQKLRTLKDVFGRYPDADEQWVVVRLPKGVSLARDYRISRALDRFETALNVLHKLKISRTRFKVKALPHSTAQWRYRVAMDSGLATPETVREWIVYTGDCYPTSLISKACDKARIYFNCVIRLLASMEVCDSLRDDLRKFCADLARAGQNIPVHADNKIEPAHIMALHECGSYQAMVDIIQWINNEFDIWSDDEDVNKNWMEHLPEALKARAKELQERIHPYIHALVKDYMDDGGAFTYGFDDEIVARAVRVALEYFDEEAR